MYMKALTFTFGLAILLLTGYVYATDYNQAVIVAQKQVQFDPRYYSGVQGLYAVGQQINQQKEVQKSTDIAELRGEIDILRKLLEGLISNKGQAVPTPAVPEAPKADKVKDDFLALMKAKCYQCHKNDSNGINMFDAQGNVTSDPAALIRIHHRTEGLVLEKGEVLMPKGGKPLSDVEMKIIKAYMRDISKQ